MCFSVFVCLVCDLSCGCVWFVVFVYMFDVVVWFVCALLCDGVWCLCVRVCVSCVLFVRFVLLCLNMLVCFCLECIV